MRQFKMKPVVPLRTAKRIVVNYKFFTLKI